MDEDDDDAPPEKRLIRPIPEGDRRGAVLTPSEACERSKTCSTSSLRPGRAVGCFYPRSVCHKVRVSL
ncbi:hypothetical protein MRX96_026220 [Rhipicephalus microplus]